MLEEKQIAIAGLLCAILGIGLLFLLNQTIAPRERSIREINETSIGERVSVSGKVDWTLEKENFVLFTLNDGARIKVIKFSPSKEERALAQTNSLVIVIGKIQLNKNELEIVAEEIRE